MHDVISDGQLRGIKILTVGWELLCHVSKLYKQMRLPVSKLEEKHSLSNESETTGLFL